MNPHFSPLRRQVVAAAVLASIGLMATVHAADEFPSRPITVVVPYPPGSATDNLLRPLAVDMQKALGQTIIIDNRPGAQGLIAAQFVARAKPDGYTLFAGSSTTLAANVGLYRTLPYDPIKDFTPVAGLGHVSMMFMVRTDSPAKTLKDYLDAARKDAAPTAAAYGSSSAQVALAMLSKATEVKFNPVPYKGTPQAITDLMGGAVPMAVVDVGNGVPQLKTGRLRALAISGPARIAAAPDVPTLLESYPDTELVTWIGLVAPAATPKPVVDRIYEAVRTVLATAEMKQKFAAVTTEVEPVAPADLGRRMQKDQVRWVELIRAAGIEPQ